MTDREMLEVALEEARAGLAEGGIPIGAALFSSSGELLGRGHNRRVQDGDPSLHGETAAFKAAGRQRSYRDTVMVTTLAPCWYCSGLVRQFGIPKVIVGESNNSTAGSTGCGSAASRSWTSTQSSALSCCAGSSALIPRCGTRISARTDRREVRVHPQRIGQGQQRGDRFHSPDRPAAAASPPQPLG